MDWVNFRDIKARVSLEQVITEYYGIQNLKRVGATAVGPCPVHGGDNPRAFHADYSKNLWNCFTGCKKGGNQLDLVVAKDGVTAREAALRLKRHFLDDDPPPGGSSPPPAAPTSGAAAAAPIASRPRPPPASIPTPDRPRKEAPVNPPLALQLHLLPDHPHLTHDRGLRAETAEHFGVGYCARGILAGCIGIPISNEAGQLVAYAGRRLKWKESEELGKYRFPKGFHKDRVVFNLHRALPEVAAGAPLILVEGFFSVLALFQAGHRAAVAAMGSELSDHQAALVAQCPLVVIAFDGDAAGRKGAHAAALKLVGKTQVRILDLPDGWEPEFAPSDLFAWLLDGATRLSLGCIAFEPVPRS